MDFVLHSRPLFIAAFDVPNYHERTSMQSITKNIPRSDAKWLGHRLAQLSRNRFAIAFGQVAIPRKKWKAMQASFNTELGN